MIELRASISESQWRAEFPGPTVMPGNMSESEHRDICAGLASEVVTIRHPDLPDGLWYLRLPEKVLSDKDAQSGSYQTGMHWSKTTDRWQFKDCPVAGLEGMLEGTIGTSQDTVRYSLTITNQSTEPWGRTVAWLCFNHSRAKRYYQYRNFVPRANAMIQTPRDLLQSYFIDGQRRDWWPPGEIEPTESLIATSGRDEDGEEFSVGIGARQAMMVGQNPNWPCTDIGLLFGDVSPGQQVTVDGRIYFTYGTPMEILKRYQQNFS